MTNPMPDTKTSCKLTYFGISLNQDGTLDPCCQYTNPPEFQRIHFSKFAQFHNTVRQRMHDDAVNDIQHAGCAKCWREESVGWTTLRQFADNWYPDPEYFSDQNPIHHVELRLGNFCNLKCVMCGPGSSSSVQVEQQLHQAAFKKIGMHYVKPNIKEYWNTEFGVPFQIEQWVDFSDQLFRDVRRVNITGGEPFIIPEVLNILDRLMLKKDSVTVSFDTNLTRVSESLLHRLEQFKNLEIVVSLEGTGAMNNYLRYPSDWEEIKNNIELIANRLPQAHVSVNHTLQHASAYSLPALVEFCHDQNLSLHTTMIQGMPHMTLASVPPEDLEKFINWVNTTDCLRSELKNFLQNVIKDIQFDIGLHQKFIDYISVLDNIRKNNYNKVFNPSKV